MVKIVSWTLLALLPSTMATNDVPGCIMANTGAINNMVDAALFIYVSTKGCNVSTPVTSLPGVNRHIAVCVSDLASVVNSVMGVGEFMAKAFQTCGAFQHGGYTCQIEGASLLAALAGVTSNAASAVTDCKPLHDKFTVTKGKFGKKPWTYAGLETCTVKVGAAMSGLQAALTSMMTIKGKCSGSDGTVNGGRCFAGILDIISAVGNLAVFLENVAANCNHNGLQVDNPCATDIGGILSNLASTASAAVGMSTCTKKKARLYVADADKSRSKSLSSTNLMSAMLLILLPITGIASYIGGSRYSRASRSSSIYATYTQFATDPDAE